MKKAIIWLAGILLVTGCTTTPTPQSEMGMGAAPKGFLGDYYGKLQPGPEGGVKQRWIKPGTDFSKYKRVMLYTHLSLVSTARRGFSGEAACGP